MNGVSLDACRVKHRYRDHGKVDAVATDLDRHDLQSPGKVITAQDERRHIGQKGLGIRDAALIVTIQDEITRDAWPTPVIL